MTYKATQRYHRTDGWRGYQIPYNAVVGASDTGACSDSPCPSNRVQAEIRRFQKEVLRPLGIRSRMRIRPTSNVFCAKRWVCVQPQDFDRAAKAAILWLDRENATLYYLHSADLGKCVEVPT